MNYLRYTRADFELVINFNLPVWKSAIHPFDQLTTSQPLAGASDHKSVDLNKTLKRLDWLKFANDLLSKWLLFLVAVFSFVMSSSVTAQVFTDISTHSQLKDAINACPDKGMQSEGCVIELACGEINLELEEPNSSGVISFLGVYIGGKNNMLIKGCGMNGTTLRYINSFSASEPEPCNQSNSCVGEKIELVTVKNSRWITLQDFKIHLEDTTDTSVKAMEISSSEDVTIERVHFHAEKISAAQPWHTVNGFNVAFPQGLNVRGGSSKISISDSKFHASGKGLVFDSCMDCWVSGSWFGSMQNTGLQQTFVLAEKRGLEVTRFENNTFDMAQKYNQGNLMGLTLERLAADEPGSGAQIVGNSFINIGDSSSLLLYPLRFYGYSEAVVSSNLFKCEEPSICQRAIRFSNASCDVDGCNQRNLIVNNQFVDFAEAGGSPDCAIWLSDSGTGNTDPSMNIVANNVINLRDLGSGAANAGVCGNVGGNNVYDNFTFVHDSPSP